MLPIGTMLPLFLQFPLDTILWRVAQGQKPWTATDGTLKPFIQP